MVINICLALDPILSELNPVHAIISYIYFQDSL
jgi:hypothetical protein